MFNVSCLWKSGHVGSKIGHLTWVTRSRINSADTTKTYTADSGIWTFTRHNFHRLNYGGCSGTRWHRCDWQQSAARFESQASFQLIVQGKYSGQVFLHWRRHGTADAGRKYCYLTPPYLSLWASVGTASHHPGCLEIWAHIRDDHPVFQRDQESADEAPSANTMSSLLQRSNFSSTPWWTCPYKTADYHFTRCLYCLQHNVYTLVRMCATRGVGTPAPQEVMSWLITELFYFVFQ